ncbi:uncharacterized protein LOC144158033 [Haemaphysalis longicornis]
MLLLLSGDVERNPGPLTPQQEKEMFDVIMQQTAASLFSPDAAAIERAQRLGRHTAEKARPIILSFLSFKDKERVLAVAAKLKGTEFALGEDYSSKVRLERKNLIQFAKDREAEYKLRFIKMKIGNETFVYNAETDTLISDTR